MTNLACHHARALVFVICLAGLASTVLRSATPAVDVLTAVAALPPHLIEPLREGIGFSETAGGEVVVLDRRGHAVHALDAGRTQSRKIVDIGIELGQLLEPGVLSLADEVFAVADGPGGFDRVQFFSMRGTRLGGFYLPRRTTPRWVAGGIVLNGIGGLHFTGSTVLLNMPDTGALISEFDLEGRVTRRVGVLRRTGMEADPPLHQAMNLGRPLADPAGGFYFVFQTGVPMFRKYDATGGLVLERHIEGAELDAAIQTLPTTWPNRTAAGGTLPLVNTLVQAAAVDRSGRLYVSLRTTHTYVYDPRGEKVRVLQLRGAGIIAPTSLSFSARTGRLLVSPGGYEFDVR